MSPCAPQATVASPWWELAEVAVYRGAVRCGGNRATWVVDVADVLDLFHTVGSKV